MKARFNLVNIDIKPAFFEKFQVWQLPKKIADDDRNKFNKDIYSAYHEGILLARAEENVDGEESWYFLTKKGTKSP